MLVAIVMIGQQLAGKALRDGFFLSHFEASALPSVMTAASLLSVGIVLGSVRLMRRFGPARSVPLFFAFSAALFVLEWALSASHPRLAAALLYLHTTSLGAVVVSGFWSIVNERFDPHTAKQVIGRIAGGAALGGVLGGLAVWLGASTLSIPTMILVFAGLNALCVVGLRGIGRPPTRRTTGAEPRVSAFEIFQETPYLRQLALLVGLTAVAGAVYDYLFKAQVAAHYGTGSELVSFFALFYLLLSVVAFGVQNLLTRPSLALLGLALTVGTLPGAVVLFGMAALLFPGISTLVALRGGTAAVESSLYRSGYELLYTPLLPEKKRPTKILVDVGGDKLGAAIGAGIAFFVLGIFPIAANPILLCVGIGAGVAAIFVTRRLHSGYVEALAESLRTGAVDLSDEVEFDATTRQTISETIVDMERAAVLEGTGISSGTDGFSDLSRDELLELLRARRAERGAELDGARREPFVSLRRSPVPSTELDESVLAIADLRSGDVERIEAALRGHNPLPHVLVPHVLPLLEKDEVAASVSEAVRRVAPAHVGLLLDVVLRVRTPFLVRRAVCKILGGVPTERSANGLVALLRDPEFELRFGAATGLLQIYRSHSRLTPPKELLFAAAELEARRCQRLWRAQTAMEGRLTQTAALESRGGKRVTHGLAYIFALLLTVLDRDSLQLAIRALADSDAAHRGTGLEYLDNVLPAGLKQSLWPLFQDGSLARETLRDRDEILDEIIGHAPPSAADLVELRERIDARRRDRAGQT